MYLMGRQCSSERLERIIQSGCRLKLETRWQAKWMCMRAGGACQMMAIKKGAA
jgi:hypothetical protein